MKRHGMTGIRIHTMWISMRQRCNNKNCQDYYLYGGRGISVCPAWNGSFETFYEWAMKSGYRDDLSIDRIDVNGNYEPSNCRFITMKEQASNKRRNVYIVYDGERVTVAEAARRCGISQGTLNYRLNNGWSDYDSTHIPVNGDYSKNKSSGHEIKHKTVLRNVKDGSIQAFASLSEASRYIGRNVGYLSNVMKKMKKDTFKAGDYIVEVQKHIN